MKQGSVELVLVGDVMLGRFVDDALTFNPNCKDTMWGDFAELIESKPQAIIAGNLECAITTEETAEPKAYSFKVKPKNAGPALKAMKFDALFLANNHSLDYGPAGLAWTLKSLHSLDIAHTGAGLTLEAALKPAIITRGGVRVAFFSFSDQYEYWAASDTQPGIAYVDPTTAQPLHGSDQGSTAPPKSASEGTNSGTNGGNGGSAESGAGLGAAPYQTYTPAWLANIAKAKQGPQGAHVVVVSMHWGPNWRWSPHPDLRALAALLVSAGVDLVFGHGPHHVQGVELITNAQGRQVPAIYSAGKFIDDFKIDNTFRNDIGCVYVARIQGGVITSLEGIPCHVQQEKRYGDPKPLPPGEGCPPYMTKVVHAGDAEFSFAATRIKALSQELGTQGIEVDSQQRVLRIPISSPDLAE